MEDRGDEDEAIRSVRTLDAGLDSQACDDIVHGLPGWFGDEDGLVEQARLVRTSAGLVCVEDGEVVGFLTYARRYERTAELTWIAIRADARRRGIGRSLLERLLRVLSQEDVTMLTVKTLSDREDPGPEYAETRAFYLRVGFIPVAELVLAIAEARREGLEPPTF